MSPIKLRPLICPYCKKEIITRIKWTKRKEHKCPHCKGIIPKDYFKHKGKKY